MSGKSNSVPQGWMEFRQGDVADFSNGRAYKLDEWEKYGIPVIRLQNLTGSGKDYYYSNLKLPDRQYCEYGDLLYMWSATFGPHIWKGPKAIYHYHIWKVTPDEVNFTKAYAYQLLGYKTSEWLNTSNGMGILHVTKGGMEDLPLILPPLLEQKKIATILSSVDDVIEKTRAQIDKLKDLKIGMMQELLTKGLGHNEFKESPLGIVPAVWEVVLMESICNKITDGEHQTPKRSKHGYFLLSARNVRDGHIALIDVDYIDEAEYKRISKRITPQEGDILISCSGSIGRTAVVPKNLRFSMVRSVAILQPKREIVDSQFLAYQVSSPLIQTQIEKSLSQLAQANLFQAPIKALKVVVPPKSEQLRIAQVVNSIVKSISDKTQKLDSLIKLKKSLMQDLLSGKVRVKVDQIDEAVA